MSVKIHFYQFRKKHVSDFDKGRIIQMHNADFCVKFPNKLDVVNLQFKELCPDLFLEIQLESQGQEESKKRQKEKID